MIYLAARTEPWVPKRELARQLGCSVRWLEYRLDPRTDGGDVLPSRMLGNRRVFKLSVVETFLREHNLLQEGA